MLRRTDGVAVRSVVVGAGQGFYGDTPRGALDVISNSAATYIGCDALAELTMAILQKDRMEDTTRGYVRDIGAWMTQLLPAATARHVRVISNGGGLNPAAAGSAVLAAAAQAGIPGIRVAVVTGDDIGERLVEMRAAGAGLAHADTGAAFDDIPGPLVFAVAYLGARPVVEALRGGADVVVTGRVADASLFVAPMVHELGWDMEEWDHLAAAVVAGHLLECSAQATGGNFDGDWQTIPGHARIGYPVCEMFEDGSFVISKPEGGGGRVTPETLAQQLLYEVGDPRRYINPDVVADFTSVRMTDLGGDRVRIEGVRGAPPPPTLKAIAGYLGGYMGVASLTYSWPEALAKARRAATLIDEMSADAGLRPLARRVEYGGAGALHGAIAEPADAAELPEVTLRYSARFAERRDAAALSRLVTPLALNGPPHIGGGEPPAPPRTLVGTWPMLVPRAAVEADVRVEFMGTPV